MFCIPHFSRSSLPQRRTESDAERSSMPQRRIESDAERCFGRDRCHSGGFLLRIMPPSWRPVPACARHDKSQAGHSSSRQRRIESVADRCCGRDRHHSGGFLLRIMPPSWRPVPACARHDKSQAGHSSSRQRRIESVADRCCGRDRHHSGGFLLRIMPPSWRPVPACARYDKP